ncbi:hypothetical protein AVEN_258634-1 [Araneus ventricosus]|uniref:Uncharacterized protein n=1 Tax=Araneus ventricosus TaxID=182803 RepID=A0A4Y2HN71_ARAVE|nr:hypothetical protein AVEN_258634-1 [Araneus ventricosus]
MGCDGQGNWTPTALISDPHLTSKEANRLRPAFVAVKAKFLDRLARWEMVNLLIPTIDVVLTWRLTISDEDVLAQSVFSSQSLAGRVVRASGLGSGSSRVLIRSCVRTLLLL